MIWDAGVECPATRDVLGPHEPQCGSFHGAVGPGDLVDDCATPRKEVDVIAPWGTKDLVCRQGARARVEGVCRQCTLFERRHKLVEVLYRHGGVFDHCCIMALAVVSREATATLGAALSLRVCCAQKKKKSPKSRRGL